MQDLLLQRGEDGIYDLVIEDSQFVSAEGLETAVITSLFTDARAPEVQVPEAGRRVVDCSPLRDMRSNGA